MKHAFRQAGANTTADSLLNLSGTGRCGYRHLSRFDSVRPNSAVLTDLPEDMGMNRDLTGCRSQSDSRLDGVSRHDEFLSRQNGAQEETFAVVKGIGHLSPGCTNLFRKR